MRKPQKPSGLPVILPKFESQRCRKWCRSVNN